MPQNAGGSSISLSTLEPLADEGTYSPRIPRSQPPGGFSSLSLGALQPEHEASYKYDPNEALPRSSERFSSRMCAAQSSGVQALHVTAGAVAPVPAKAGWVGPEGHAGQPSHLSAKIERESVEQGRHFFGQVAWPRRDNALEPQLSGAAQLSPLGLQQQRGHWGPGSAVLAGDNEQITPRGTVRGRALVSAPEVPAAPTNSMRVRESTRYRATFEGAAAKALITGSPLR